MKVTLVPAMKTCGGVGGGGLEITAPFLLDGCEWLTSFVDPFIPKKELWYSVASCPTCKILPTRFIYVFSMIIAINNSCFPKHLAPARLCIEDMSVYCDVGIEYV